VNVSITSSIYESYSVYCCILLICVLHFFSMSRILFIAVYCSFAYYTFLAFIVLGAVRSIHSSQDLQHLFKTADITESGQETLLTEGIYTVADFLRAEYRISNGCITLSRGNRIDLIYIVNWIRAFKEEHGRMPNVLTEFTIDSFEEFQNRPNEDLHFVNTRMLLDLYLGLSENPDIRKAEVLNDISSTYSSLSEEASNLLNEGSRIEDISNRLRQGKETKEDLERIAQLLPGLTEKDINMS
jgi:hypothetical protein